jgi:hypothetical protein
MNPLTKLSACALLSAICFSAITSAQQTVEATQKSVLDIFEMKSVPDETYLVNLQIGGQEHQITFAVKNNTAQAMKSSDPRLRNLRGEFELIGGNGVFLIRLRNDQHTASQFWLFRPDGTAVIKEIPDRGEKQKAVPVKGN